MASVRSPAVCFLDSNFLHCIIHENLFRLDVFSFCLFAHTPKTWISRTVESIVSHCPLFFFKMFSQRQCFMRALKAQNQNSTHIVIFTADCFEHPALNTKSCMWPQKDMISSSLLACTPHVIPRNPSRVFGALLGTLITLTKSPCSPIFRSWNNKRTSRHHTRGNCIYGRALLQPQAPIL